MFFLSFFHLYFFLFLSSACGKVVCVLCAPAGDILPGDGINEKTTITDFRIPLPWLGNYLPQRVCIHCYFDSSYPGLEPQEF